MSALNDDLRAGTVSHHLSDETLQEYAAGNLSVPMETLIACHLTRCPLCRRRAEMADSLGGQQLYRAEPTAARASARDVLAMARQRSTAGGDTGMPAEQSAAVTKPIGSGEVPRPLARMLNAPLESLDWRRMAPGIQQVNLSDLPRRYGAFKLLHLEPGVVLSHHGHNDRELTYVVSGSYQDEIGRFKAGDIADLGEHDAHRPVVDSHEPCIALIATDSPVRFSGMFGRMMQPFVGI